MDFTKICKAIVFFAAFSIPSVSLADDTDYKSYVEGALQVYKQFEEPSVKESQKFLNFVNTRWKDSNEQCFTACSLEGKNAAKDYASTNNIKLNEDKS